MDTSALVDDSTPIQQRSQVPALQVIGVTKSFPGVRALASVDFDCMEGEVHALVGENGYGKSTMIKAASGVYDIDEGQIFIGGQDLGHGGVQRSRRLGLITAYQDTSLVNELTVADNIALALSPRDAGRRGLRRRIREVSKRYGLPLDPARRVHTMSVGERQRVEIVRCLLQDPRLLILDEPTSVLTPQAVDALFDTLRHLAAEGCSIVYISHKLDEIRALCDRATVLRAGRVTGTCDPRSETASSLARMMIGHDLPRPKHRAARAGADALVVERLDVPADDPFGVPLQNVSLRVRTGETGDSAL